MLSQEHSGTFRSNIMHRGDSPSSGHTTPRSGSSIADTSSFYNESISSTCPFEPFSFQPSSTSKSVEVEEIVDPYNMETPDDENGRPRCPVAHHVNPNEIKHDLQARIDYMTKFVGFDERDVAHIKHVAPLIKELIPGLVDHLYAKLFEFDITKKVFLMRGSGFDGNIPKKLEDLTLDSEQIKFRKIFMKVWATRILTSDYTDGKTWAYMDKVGEMHTGVHTFKKHKTLGNDPLFVPYRDVALTLGWVQNVLITSVLSLSDQLLSMPEKIATVQALTKVIWLQNDLFSRHYIKDSNLNKQIAH